MKTKPLTSFERNRAKLPKGAYAIAAAIPLRYRKKMVAVKYRMNANQERVCATGRCPLGWIFADSPKGGTHGHKMPGGPIIARRLFQIALKRVKGLKLWELAEIAETFYADWDDGKIKNLRRAMGLPKE